ncbi:hypothetical protein LUW75_08270 [Streptomyces sp. MRC013]|uniref:hypothetical protein n=1 Tax=Streptomyces sp. MRC013 TaxID=2898276 RepID=UPI002025D4A6|nr:hypothetical protein [Streptomyces sp. MRC013]URM89978.1 hypothetical protein LUW75_08270 [Streptomyces sp. MRC013]
MLRHEFHPGRLVAGVTGLGVAVVYEGDATGAWDAPWYAGLLLLCCGLVLAAVASRVGHRARRRAARAAGTGGAGPPTGTSGGRTTEYGLGNTGAAVTGEDDHGGAAQ